jgi:ABC-2 type transport system ATP-binding protein
LALAARPDVAFLDEPTSGVDVNGRLDIRNIITGLADRGCCVVLATHELDEAERIADRVVVFDQGAVVAEGSLDELRGTSRRIRFRLPDGSTPPDFAAHALTVVRDGVWFEIADSSAATVARLTALLESAGIEAVDLRVGQASLEDVFRRLTRGEAS